MLIYCPESSARLQYIVDLLLSKLLGIEYQLTSFPGEFIQFEGPKLNYSLEPIGDTPFLACSGMLFEPGVVDQTELMGPVFQWKNLPAFYPAEAPSILPFDIFSAAFYLVSRFEENLPFQGDQHGRFPAVESMAFKEGFLELPLVNLWTIQLGQRFKEIYGSQFPIKLPKYQFLPTIDIDTAWAFKNKGMRGLGAFLKTGQKMEDRNYRYQVLRGKQTDPYDQYYFLEQLFKKHDLDPIYFFLAGKRSRYDRNIRPESKAFQKLVKNTAREFRIGIHPSYASNFNPERVQIEIDRLAKISGTPITRSRQHFLKFELPETYRNLHLRGIREEYSMGFADHPGFRAGIATPFPFFDLQSNRATNLTVYPFQIMDVTLKDYLHLNPEQALAKINALAEQTRSVGGTFCCLWHNESLSEWNSWNGWSSVFAKMLETAI